MTGMYERLAKVAEVEFAHRGYKSAGVGEGWLCWCGERLSNWWPEGGVTPRDTALDYALRSHRVQAFAPLLAEWRAEDRAQALREAADALFSVAPVPVVSPTGLPGYVHHPIPRRTS